MIRSLLSLASGVALLSACAIGCGGTGSVDGDGETTGPGASASGDQIATNVDALAWRTRARSRTTTTASAPTATAAAPTATSTSAATGAQTADGKAIPQPAGPGGQCPAVVVQYGFWSCVTIGEQCSYTADGASHDCTCSRVDGEGQAPEWLCN
ncbi:MAG TPA: hypothetical protein VH062_14385 [Polyangiaceae bacterium]|jgi:hypothetical protein|nr:hypothetical protein [Polyangiaceae bacterium]